MIDRIQSGRDAGLRYGADRFAPSRRSPRALVFVFAAMLTMITGIGGHAAAQTLDAGGWTDFLPSPDSRIVYVSASGGNDQNTGYSPQSPVQTINKGLSLLRDGYPDWMLLKRGDVWNVSNVNWNKSGRSESEPVRMSAYGPGAERPRIVTTGNGIDCAAASRKNIAFTGVHFKSAGGGGDGMRVILGLGENLLIEDVMVEGYQNNLNIQGFGSPGVINNLKIRRSIIANAASTGGGHSQGIYLAYVHGALIEESIIDRNGWSQNSNPSGPGYPTIFNHNVYIQSSCTDVVFRGNIVTDASSHGVQVRPGGIVEDNLFVRNPLALLLGGGDPSSYTENGVTGSVRRNVVLEGRDISPAAPRGFGIDLSNVASSVVVENLVAHAPGCNQPRPFSLVATGYGSGVGVNNTEIHDNIIYKWGGNAVRFMGPASAMQNLQFRDNDIQVFDNSYICEHSDGANVSGLSSQSNRFHSTRSPSQWFNVGPSGLSLPAWGGLVGDVTSVAQEVSYPDPSRTVSSYSASLGGSASYESFMTEVRKQSRANWRPEYSAGAVNDYIRQGFGLASE